MNARIPDQDMLERAIAEQVQAFEVKHGIDVSSIWVEHAMSPRAVEVTVVTKPTVKFP